jgi:LysR family transcriptional regulator, nod-box dependent transcriptional activator
MRFKGLDLNLLFALDVLVEEGSVSRAAERLNVSQPAMSASLARLRQFFGNPLLVAQGRRMIPTAEAIALQRELKPLLGRLDELIATSTAFDPARSDRIFRICASDYLVAVLFNRLVIRLQDVAPSIRLDIVAPSHQAQSDLDRGEIDLLLTPQEHCVEGHPTELLLTERHVVVGWSGNPSVQQPLTVDAFIEAEHVAVRVGQGNRASFAENQLASMAPGRRIQITASSFTSVPDLLVGTRRLAVMHRLLARVMASRLDIAWQEMPFPFPDMQQMVQINRARRDDPGLRWLVSQMHAATATLLGAPAVSPA